MPSDTSRENDLLDLLAEDFVARYRRGDRPSITEFTARHPELADEIRDLFPALIMMEEARAPAEDTRGGSRSPHFPELLERVGEYRILREVGRGGMGIVYEAEQESLSRHVAVKVLPAHSLLEPRLLHRFKLEARAAARLHHTNIVPVFGVGQDNGLNYYVMQFIQGRGLDEVLVELRRLRGADKPRIGSSFRSDARSGPNVGRCDSADRAKTVSAEQIAAGLVSGEFSDPASDHLPPWRAVVPTAPAFVPSAPSVPSVSSDSENHGRQVFDDSNVPATSEVRLPGHEQGSSWSDSSRDYWLGVARIGAQVADALAYAHSQGVLHRDIKPSNLLLDTQGSVWVTDFGLAKETSSGDGSTGVVPPVGLTRTGDVVGTLRYLAPERLKGDSDQGSDIYSLGATLYELLTLRPPFEESDRSVLVRRLLHDEPTCPRSLDPTIPLDLETIVGKAMAKEPSDRYRSPAELGDDLRCFLTDRPIRARRVTIWERTWRLCRRNRVVTSLSAAVLLLFGTLAVGAMIAGWIRSERDQAVIHLARAERAEASSRNNLARARSAERDARIRAHLTQAIVERKRGTAGHRARSLREIDDALAMKPTGALREDLRNELIASLAHTDVVRSATSWDYWGYTAPLDVDPAYERYALVTREGFIRVRRIADNWEVLQLQPPRHNAPTRSLLFSPDGKHLASFSTEKHVLVWETDHGELVLNAVDCGYAYDFTADSRSIVTVRDHECLLYDLATAKVGSRWPTEFVATYVVCSPDGQRIAIAAESRLQICSSGNGKRIREWISPQPIHSVAWHPGGKTLAVGCASEIHLWDLDDPKPYAKRPCSVVGGTNVAFSHDGRLLANADWGAGLTIWDHPTGMLLCSVQGALFLRFGRDDQQVGLYQDGPRVGVREIVRSDVFHHVVSGKEQDIGVLANGRFSPDGRLLAVGTTLGLGFWDFSTGRQLSFAPIGRVLYLKFDRDSLLTSPWLRRWPIQGASHRRKFVIGPPESLGVEAQNEFDIDGDGRILAAAQFDGAVVIDRNRPDEPIYLRPHDDCRYVAVDGEGRWVATGSHWGSNVKVWDASTGSLVATLPAESVSPVEFSPDGRWLYTTGYGPGWWRTGTWEPGPHVDGPILGFSPDSRLLVAQGVPDSLLLIEVGTGRTLARLEHPSGYASSSTVFSPDGTTLVGVGTRRSSGFAWDLRRLREELSARGLDWDLPPYPPAESESTVTEPMQLELIAAQTDTRTQLEIAGTKMEQYRAAYQANPDDATACNQLAWALATAPESLRAADEAVELAEKGVRLQPKDANIRNTLGVAYYRAGRFQEAADSLAANLSGQQDSALPYDLYFLAMSHHQLGESERARDYLILANRWVTSHRSDDALGPDDTVELEAIRAEAEALLGD